MIVMLQNLLADRFKLQAEREQKPGTVYVLTVDPGGLKIVENNDAPQTELSFEATPDGNFVLRATAITVGRLIFSRPFWGLGAPVVDSTGLSGRYDIRWVLGNPENDAFEPFSIIDTCKRQLGLKLEKTNGQVDVVNIIHVQKPTEN